MAKKWKLAANNPPDGPANDNYTAYFPERDEQGNEYESYKFVKLIIGEKVYRFRYATFQGGTGDCINLSKKNLQKLGKNSEPEIEKLSESSYLRHSLWGENRWLLIGFLIALSGALIDAALKLGDKGYGIKVPDWWIAILRWTSSGMAVFGVIFLFLKGLNKK